MLCARGRRAATMALIFMAVGVCVTAPLAAQNPQGRRGPPQDRAEMERRFRAQMTRLVQERLQLSNEESLQLGEAMQRFDTRRRDIRRSEVATRRRVEALMIEGGDDQAAAELLARLSDLRHEESALFDEEQEALLEVLTPTQVLQLQALREEMGRRIRALRGGDRGERPGRPGGAGNVDGLLGVPLSR